MAISRANAQAAITALVGGGALNFSKLDEFNSHMTEKHFSKTTAQAAALNGAPQGYFKRLTPLSFVEFGDLYKPGISKTTRARVLAAANTPTAGDFVKRPDKVPVNLDVKFAASKTDWTEIAWGVITSPDLELRESTTNPQLNFIAVAPIPGRGSESSGSG